MGNYSLASEILILNCSKIVIDPKCFNINVWMARNVREENQRDSEIRGSFLGYEMNKQIGSLF